ncbi:unnamed protein product [Acanthoscelides obtectus]|uniref:RING-type domain-containing protein n=1 Tax=Acanthoscelides obtectus TaxID=200917 RepID=A0A9P0LGD3_ACAOB|nr:unnamed protein product [Acanthoscelides obtectus]CAK1682249.1 E3 ubiquitin-protein ligase RNF144A [Acanthoscelides obtectus]
MVVSNETVAEDIEDEQINRIPHSEGLKRIEQEEATPADIISLRKRRNLSAKKRAKQEGKPEDVGIPFDSDLIKCCPMCNVPIEKDEGCAQMMCKRCKHVFCWYCLASLDDDFLLWHRTQVVGIFASFGNLLLAASPLLLLAAPCIACSRCRLCNADDSSSRLSEDDDNEGAERRNSMVGARKRGAKKTRPPGADDHRPLTRRV